MKYEAVIFDLDGVIISTDEFHYLAWKSLADEIGIPFNEADNEKLRGVSRMESLELILEKGTKLYTLDEKELLATKKNDIYVMFLEKLTKNDLDIEVKETLLKLREKGIKLAIGSSSKNTKMILKQIGLSNFFDAVADGTMLEYSKPHPEVFMLAADMLKTEYKKCIVIEDAESGCIAAKSASMSVAAISSSYGYSVADYHLNSFANILQII